MAELLLITTSLQLVPVRPSVLVGHDRAAAAGGPVCLAANTALVN